MRNRLVVMSVMLALAAAGCETANQATVPKDIDAWLVQAVQNPQIEGAILAQHTLYPYHFFDNGAVLNELGQRDLAVLSRHFRDKSGEVNVSRGTATDDLYAARVSTVVKALAEAGVPAARVKIADQLPGGDGLSGDKVVKVLEKEYQPVSAGTGTGTGMSFFTGTSSR